MTMVHDNDGIMLSEEDKRRRRARSVALAFALAGLAVMFFVITIVKLGPAVFNRPL
jgi:hypothetical protein